MYLHSNGIASLKNVFFKKNIFKKKLSYSYEYPQTNSECNRGGGGGEALPETSEI